MEVYIDVIIMENFIVDLFLLSVTFKILRHEHQFKKLVISAIIGAIYTITMLFKSLHLFTLIPVQILVAFFMSYLITGKGKLILTLKSTGLFILSSITLSGLCFLFSFIENKYIITESFTLANSSMKYLLVSIMIMYIVFDRVTSYLRERAIIGNCLYDIEITIDKMVYIIKGFLDTGNELREPVTNLPCIIIEERILAHYEINEDKTYYINYSGVGYQGKIKGFKVDKVRIKQGKEEFKEVMALICPCNDTFSSDKEFNALLSRGVI